MAEKEVNHRESEAGLPATVNYRYADLVGDELFVAGQVPHDTNGQLVGIGDPSAQTTVCLDNLALVMKVHGFAVSDIRHLTVYVVGEREALGESWAAVERWFDHDVPPATLLGVYLLGHDQQLVELDARIRRQ